MYTDFINSITTLIESLTALNYAVIIINLLLIIFARPIIKSLSLGNMPQSKIKLRIRLLRGLNLLILVTYGYQYIYQASSEKTGGIKIMSILAILYIAHFANYLAQHFIQKYYGKTREIYGKNIFIPTYQTRLFSILAAIFLTIFALILIVQQLGFDSLLKAGGAIGFIGVILGLTQGSWAPDIISGLIILNSDMFEEGDIVDLNDGKIVRIFKTKLFHTEVLDLSNNHRIMVRNAHMRDKTIHNLSKFASSKGLRECLSFNIGYDVSPQKAKAMFTEAFNNALTQDFGIEKNVPIEIRLLETGDHALQWGVLFHVKQVDKIIEIRRLLKECILTSSLEHNITLATPFTLSTINQ